MLALCLLGTAANAATLGELTLASRLNEPLLAYVELTAQSEEKISADCFSLTQTGVLPVEQSHYLTDAQLMLEQNGTQRRLRITTASPAAVSAMKLLLKMECSGGEKTLREFILPFAPMETDAGFPGGPRAVAGRLQHWNDAWQKPPSYSHLSGNGVENADRGQHR